MKLSLSSLKQISTKKINLKKVVGVTASLLGIAVIAGTSALHVQASDHDDGETDIKGRNLNLTDLYVFRESDQNPKASADNLVLIMNTNPRSLARQQYYFSTKARYEFMIDAVTDKDAPVAGKADVTLRFKFDAPDANQRQAFTVTAIHADGRKQRATGFTTPLNQDPTVNSVSLGNDNLKVFAGLREDPFFFDVEQFFRVRAGALGIGPAVGFRDPSQAVDFATGYNVNAIAVQLPIDFLQGADSKATTFDVWQTISFKNRRGKFKQVERLARPAVNEGLVFTQEFLQALNEVTPAFEAAALAGKEKQANAVAPIVGEVKQVLLSLGNSSERADSLIGAFLPDVMRIDTTGESGYANDLNAKGSPVRGRLLKDDVVDITLSVLTDGKITTDNVSYEGTPGNPGQGHQPLDQNFPYLAPAN
ncbi:hypothetical protein Lepto7376_4579 [[Leptolyngbya] sp. PCC 7376]|uniref:DUF4331 domain-containing protein n=1 Tax=[Leptolyngbya] sp. PCC 7376 TaxID=111781 RepID=UPI00029EEE1E|nr:DUF4331 domain-containing protein [[Leptolyngbya] sp. PCC 7376]AFY40670.1 hypothetical protein Lepto7376_4579 [[Leptolyngbya] sp. PCC 7376]